VTNKEPSTTLAKQELLELLIKYLPERFPDKFEAREGGIYNKMLLEFTSISDGPGQEDPLMKAGRLTQEDWCVMEWKEEHQVNSKIRHMINVYIVIREITQTPEDQFFS
jgi:hypothetical protein